MMGLKKKVILFGITQIEYTPALHYIEKYRENVILIIDNNPNLHGDYNGVPVCCQNMLPDYADDADVFIVITTFRGHSEIVHDLLDMGFSYDRFKIALKDVGFYTSYIVEFYRRKYDSLEFHPERVNIELSRNCNCRCIYCPMFGIHPVIKSEMGFMSWNVVKAITEQISKVTSITTGYFCGKGETYFHPECFEIIEYIMKNSNIKNLIFYSNGMLLNKETVHKLDSLRFNKLTLEISIDGETAEENDQYRRGSNYGIVRENIKYAMRYLSKKNVAFQILNTHPITEDYLKKNDYVIPYALPVPEFIQNDFPDVSKGSRSTIMFSNEELCEGNGIVLRKKCVKRADFPYPCINAFNEINFDFRGNSLTCTCDMNSYNKPIANVFHDDVLDCWKNGNVMQTMRKKLLNGKIPKECVQCMQFPVKKFNVAVKMERKNDEF